MTTQFLNSISGYMRFEDIDSIKLKYNLIDSEKLQWMRDEADVLRKRISELNK